MAENASYCKFVSSLPEGDLHRVYHDLEYGFPLQSDDQLFGRLILEINQAGLSWTTILKKKDHFELAYSGFKIDAIASYKEKDIDRLLQDPGIIRNRLKVQAAIHNAKVIQGFQKEFGSFLLWLYHHHPLEKTDWVKLFRKHFRFTGGEIVNEFLTSTGFLPGAHHEECPVYMDWVKSNPPCLKG